MGYSIIALFLVGAALTYKQITSVKMFNAKQKELLNELAELKSQRNV